MDHPVAGVDALLFLRLDVGLGGAAVTAFLDERRDARIILRGFQRQRMFGGDGNERRAHQRVRTRREYRDRIALAVHRELDFETFGAADPVALHDLDGLGPARQVVQFAQQFVGVGGDLEKPLRDFALFDQRAGAPAAAVDHLFVGEHGLVDRIPVHHRFLAVGQSLLEQTHEHALFVDVVFRLARGELARPVDRIAERFQLLAHVIDVGVCPLRRRGVVLDRGVFGGQAERIPRHRLQHVEAAHAPIAADRIADGVVAHVAHVQRAAGVRQHRQTEIFRPAGVFFCLEGACVVPQLLRRGFHRREIVIFLHGL